MALTDDIRIRLAAGALIAALGAAPAWGGDPVEFRVERIGPAARILIIYPDSAGDDRPRAEARFAASSVLVIDLSRAIDGDAAAILDALPDRVALARIDPDGGALRLAMRGPVQPHVSASYNMVAIDLAPPGATAPAPVMSPREVRERQEAEAARAAAAAAAAAASAPAPALPVGLRFAQAEEYSRLELRWPEPVGHTLSQDGETADIVFDRPAEVDLSALRASPPRRLANAEEMREGDAWRLRLTLTPGARARVWADGATVVIDLHDADNGSPLAILAALAAAAETAPDSGAMDEGDDSGTRNGAAAAEPEPELAPDTAPGMEAAPVEPAAGPSPLTDAVPEGGVVRAEARDTGADLQARFSWAAPVGAAVFRRGGAIWIVFDAEADLQLDELAHGRRGHVVGYESLRGAGWSAARIVSPLSTQASVRSDGNSWTVVFADNAAATSAAAAIRRETRRGSPARFIVGLDSATALHWVDDPAVGDRIAVVTAHAPVQGVALRRDFVGGALLPSAHGAAVEAAADELTAVLEAGEASFALPDGLAIAVDSSQATARFLDNGEASPAFIDIEGWAGEGRYAERRAALERTAAAGGAEERLALARFLIAHELAPESLGVLNTLAEEYPHLAAGTQVRAVRGVANLMMGRLAEARVQLNDPALAADPAAAPWRALLDAAEENWPSARRRFEAASEILYDFPPRWRMRFRAAHARAAIELNDFAAAATQLQALRQDTPAGALAAEAEWLEARLQAATGDPEGAVARFEALADSGYAEIEARAIFDAIRLRMDAGTIDPTEAAEELESLRYRWRGDTLELETIRLLGSLYAREGAFAMGLSTMRSAQARFPAAPAARRMGSDMMEVFRRLYLYGDADRMDPIEAVALFYEYEYLTPQGADGDRMIRRLTDRLVALDLLTPASELLQHQVDNRLYEPVTRSRVAADLAILYLMDHRAEQALNALRATRVAGAPELLVTERRLLEARALSELGRHVHALELIEHDESADAARLRADISWTQSDWPRAGERIEAVLGQRWRDETPLSAAEQADVLRAAIAYNLAGDRASVRRLAERYGEAMADGTDAAAFTTLTSDRAGMGDARIGDLARRLADIDTLDAFMARFRDRFQADASAGGAS